MILGLPHCKRGGRGAATQDGGFCFLLQSPSIPTALCCARGRVLTRAVCLPSRVPNPWYLWSPHVSMLGPTLVAGCFRLVLPPVEKQNCRICSVGFLSNNSTAKGSGQNILCFKYLSLGMNPGIPQQPSWKLTTDFWPPAQLDPCCQVKFQIHLEFHVTLIGIVLPWVSLGSTVADAVVSSGTMVALGATWPVHPRCCAAWLDTGTVFCSSGDPPGTLAVRKATKNSHPLFQSIS